MERDKPRRRCAVLAGSIVAGIVAAAVFVTAADSAERPLPEVLISRQLMVRANVHVGDIVTLAKDPGGAAALQVRVGGTYEPTPDPMKFSEQRLEIRLHLPDLMALASDAADPLSSESVNTLNVALVDPRDAGALASTIATRMPGLVAQPTGRPNEGNEGADPFAALERFHWAIAIVTVIGSSAFLLALMVMRAEERRHVIGILRLIGIPARSILVEVLLEGTFIAVGGAVFGLAVAATAQSAINRFFQWRYDTALVFVRVTLPIAWQSLAIAVPLGILSGVAASWTLLRRDVSSLVRR